MSAKTKVCKHKYYMTRCLALARRGQGQTSPNPMVGALLVKNGVIVGKGWHRIAGGPHAEVEAIADAGEAAEGSTLYVTLEPCNHHGRTGPCTEAVLSAGIKEVVVAMPDPNTGVKGGGSKALREAGVVLESGVLEERARRLNYAWLSSLGSRKSFLELSLDLSLGGAIIPVEDCFGPVGNTMPEQESPAAEFAIIERKRCKNLDACDAVLVDTQTLSRAGELQRREALGRRPLVLLDPELGWTTLARSLGTSPQPPISVLCSAVEADGEQMQWLREHEIDFVHIPGPGECLDLDALRDELYRRACISVYCELSPQLSNYFLKCRAIDRLSIFRHSEQVTAADKQGELPRLEIAEPQLSLLHMQRLGNCCFSVYDIHLAG